MASLKNLTDDELRRQLREHGIMSPVTASSRSILLKKLNHIIANSQNELRKSGKGLRASSARKRNIESISATKPGRNSTLNSFSSDEDDVDNSSNSAVGGKVLRRSTRRSVERSPKGIKPRSSLTNFNDSDSESIERTNADNEMKRYSPSFSHLRPPPRRESGGGYGLTNGLSYDTGSDSDLDGNENTDSYSSANSGSLWNRGPAAMCKPPIQYETYKKPNSRSPDNRRLLPMENSGWTRRNTRMVRPILKETEITSPDDIVSHQSLSSNISMPNGRMMSGDLGQTNTSDGSIWLQSVPLLLVVLLGIFFTCLALCYINIHTPILPSLQGFASSWTGLFTLGFWKSGPQLLDSSEGAAQSFDVNEPVRETVPLSDNRFPICNEEEITMDCLSQEEMSGAKNLLSLLADFISPALSEQASLYQCGDSPNQYLSLQKLKITVKKALLDVEEEEMTQGFNGLGKLAALNPHWGIVPEYEVVNDDSLPDLIGFSSSNQPKEILCHVTKALVGFGYFLVTLCFVFCTAWISYSLIRFYKRRSEEIEQNSFELVEQILEYLENSCGTDGKDFIAVNHVRDCLIPPRERKSKSEVWERAVKFIDDHDSRVYREVRQVGGEECEVWRWVSGAPRSPIACQPKTAYMKENDSDNVPDKVWQGQAFENLENSSNVPAVSPTSCLKIRNMFDGEVEFGDEWPRRIQDALLEKCEGVEIVHITVDKASKEGCVYLKCSSTREAGKAYKALHGWWFDRNLLTVKFLRDERYHERFPTARLATTPLRPSNNAKLSLQSTLNSINSKNRRQSSRLS